MEISGAVVSRSRGFTAAARGGYSDEGHLRYYVAPVRCGGRKMEEKKKQARIVKEMSRDLSAIGFRVEKEGGDLNGKMMTEAADMLMSQLKQLKAEEKELKRKKKELKAAAREATADMLITQLKAEEKELKRRKKEQKAAMKAAQMKDRKCDDSSSSSSSESSDSECETVVRTSNLKKAEAIANMLQSEMSTVPFPMECYSRAVQIPIGSCSGSIPAPMERCSGVVLGSNPMTEPAAFQIPKQSGNAAAIADKIEVCMGGKCKKSGAMELMAEFEKIVGVEGAVVGCKCMGKCKDGPNVRVKNGKEEGIRVSRNPLCIGVGLEDVGSIVANFFEEKEAGLMAS